MDAVEITKYKDMALRRKYWIVIPFLLAVLGGLTTDSEQYRSRSRAERTLKGSSKSST
jgi:hypothetical protein